MLATLDNASTPITAEADVDLWGRDMRSGFSGVREQEAGQEKDISAM